jgi:ABC-type Na+ efflux pump permease subunit
LIISDWQRHRRQILLCIAAGGVALALLEVGGEVTTIAGVTWFFVALIVLGSMLPVSNVVNERKKQILPFLMSLPVSVTQYTTAKLVSTVGMFLVSWVTLVAGAVLFIISRQGIPDGMVPTAIVLYGVEPTDPLAVSTAILILLLVGILAALFPARRASRTDPAAALRET